MTFPSIPVHVLYASMLRRWTLAAIPLTTDGISISASLRCAIALYGAAPYIRLRCRLCKLLGRVERYVCANSVYQSKAALSRRDQRRATAGIADQVAGRSDESGSSADSGLAPVL